MSQLSRWNKTCVPLHLNSAPPFLFCREKAKAISLPPSDMASPIFWFSLKSRQFSSPTLDSGEWRTLLHTTHYVQCSRSSIFPATLDHFLIQGSQPAPYILLHPPWRALLFPALSFHCLLLRSPLCASLQLSRPFSLAVPHRPLFPSSEASLSSPGPFSHPVPHSLTSYQAAPPAGTSFVKNVLPRSHIAASFSWPPSAPQSYLPACSLSPSVS